MHKKIKIDGHRGKQGHYLNFMHFNGGSGSVFVFPFFQAMTFRRGFSAAPHGLPNYPKGGLRIAIACVQLIAFIDLIGPPGHFSKTVIENAS